MGENIFEDGSAMRFLRDNALKLIIIGLFFGGQYYLIEYRLGQVENAVSQNNNDLIQRVNDNSLSIEENSSRIHTIEVERAGEMSQIRQVLVNIQHQMEQLNKMTERQADQIEYFMKQQGNGR